jgi:hypothetical protein
LTQAIGRPPQSPAGKRRFRVDPSFPAHNAASAEFMGRRDHIGACDDHRQVVDLASYKFDGAAPANMLPANSGLNCYVAASKQTTSAGGQ